MNNLKRYERLLSNWLTEYKLQVPGFVFYCTIAGQVFTIRKITIWGVSSSVSRGNQQGEFCFYLKPGRWFLNSKKIENLQ
ncbi:hypothetical protein Nit79A3_2364 [Nitrosomonas sp. Is79A3]